MTPAEKVNGRPRVVLAVVVALLALSRPAVAQDLVTRVSVVQLGTRVIVHVRGPREMPRIGEPFYLPDRTRLHVVIDGAALAPNAITPDGSAILDSGLLGLVARDRDGGVRVSIEASAVLRYGIEPQADGFVFWLVPAPTVAPRIACVHSCSSDRQVEAARRTESERGTVAEAETK
jgi:hypothetical protein